MRPDQACLRIGSGISSRRAGSRRPRKAAHTSGTVFARTIWTYRSGETGSSSVSVSRGNGKRICSPAINHIVQAGGLQ